jgi:hypothetical protein
VPFLGGLAVVGADGQLSQRQGEAADQFFIA